MFNVGWYINFWNGHIVCSSYDQASMIQTRNFHKWPNLIDLSFGRINNVQSGYKITNPPNANFETAV